MMAKCLSKATKLKINIYGLLIALSVLQGDRDLAPIKLMAVSHSGIRFATREQDASTKRDELLCVRHIL